MDDKKITKSGYVGRQHNLFAISIRQPFADLIVSGIKPVENRSQNFKLTGVILVHASKSFECDWEKMLSQKARSIAKKHISQLMIGSMGFSPFSTGSIIGAAIITHSDEFFQSDWCMPGCYYIWLSNQIKFSKPIPCNGMLKIFRPAIMLNQFTDKDLAELNRLYDISTAWGLQKLPITNFRDYD